LNQISIKAAPKAVLKWRAFNNNNMWTVPSNLDPSHLEDTITWYIRLQPLARGAKWPLARGPDATSWDWKEVSKGGRGGIFLLLMAVSWFPKCGAADEERMNEVVDDIKWVLRTLTERIQNPPAKGGRKRKAEAGTKPVATAKRQRKSKN
jgi:hypothetical protein